MPVHNSDKERLGTLGDGIFAIAMTLLVLDIKVPQISAVHSATELNNALLLLWPKLLSYLLSFAILGIFWICHHAEYGALVHTNRRHIWLTLAAYFLISCVPFSASLLGEFTRYQSATLIYGLNMLGVSLLMDTGWSYARMRGKLVKSHDSHIPNNTAANRLISVRLRTASLIYTVGLVASFISPLASLLIYVSAPLFFVVAQTK